MKKGAGVSLNQGSLNRVLGVLIIMYYLGFGLIIQVDQQLN